MKKTLYTLLVAALCLGGAMPASAQGVSNGGFENWTPRNNTERPVGWATTDDLLASIGLPVASEAVSKTSDKKAGSFAVKLENKSVLGALEMPGFAVLGTLPDLSSADFMGVPFSGRPSHFQFHYKQTGTNIADDSALVVVALTRYVNGHREVIGGMDSLLRAAPSTYTLMSLPLQYLSAGTPDSVFVLFNSATAEDFTIGNALYIDELAFTGTVTAAAKPKLAANLQVYPNPSTTGRFTVSIPDRDLDLAGATLTVTDAQGRTVLRQAYSPTGQPPSLDLQSHPAGFYLLRLDTPRGFAMQRLVKS